MSGPLVAERLSVGHDGRTILADVDLTLPASTVTVLVGPNGCGKSTMLRTLAGLQRPTGGQVRVLGDPLDKLSRRELSQRLAFLPQTPLVPAGITVRELARNGRYAHRGAFARHTAEDLDAVEWALRVTNALPLAGKRVNELSGGERQRAWLAAVLAQKADILLLDEPTTYLDLRYQVEVLEVVRSLAHEHGMACGLVLHDLGQASSYGDRVMLTAGGEILGHGTPAEVLTSEGIARAFGLDVKVVHDSETGGIACFPRTSAN
ncbi:ABC transporter ATP-binding protein [Acrocarpospora macrocephala]|uniref:Iron-enterobactin transporter ATP-binding protein n=1 Tax=Acrocarpospora macrocephala TaxID=150177 RepID=A0A5M3WMB9_9ACTN|nr:ABC transporter ATP-binding protein [Acrocarpospora macrocephala]GES09776.1 iron-enterobactin transporter ATP-binding protein [Acrocarpospora macrocephala]